MICTPDRKLSSAHIGKVSDAPTHPGKTTYQPSSGAVAAFLPRRNIKRLVGEESVGADDDIRRGKFEPPHGSAKFLRNIIIGA